MYLCLVICFADMTPFSCCYWTKQRRAFPSYFDYNADNFINYSKVTKNEYLYNYRFMVR